MFSHPKTKDPRAPGRSINFASNNKEAALFSWPMGHTKKSKIMHRAEFNTCGEVSTTSTTYTGIAMRRFGELPRMDHDTKLNILGSAASGAATSKRLQADIDEKGHPFSWSESKPLPLWQRMCEHHSLTHIVDSHRARAHWPSQPLARCSMKVSQQMKSIRNGWIPFWTDALCTW